MNKSIEIDGIYETARIFCESVKNTRRETKRELRIGINEFFSIAVRDSPHVFVGNSFSVDFVYSEEIKQELQKITSAVIYFFKKSDLKEIIYSILERRGEIFILEQNSEDYFDKIMSFERDFKEMTSSKNGLVKFRMISCGIN